MAEIALSSSGIATRRRLRPATQLWSIKCTNGDTKNPIPVFSLVVYTISGGVITYIDILIGAYHG
jgi:hypothetical protein